MEGVTGMEMVIANTETAMITKEEMIVMNGSMTATTGNMIAMTITHLAIVTAITTGIITMAIIVTAITQGLPSSFILIPDILITIHMTAATTSWSDATNVPATYTIAITICTTITIVTCTYLGQAATGPSALVCLSTLDG
jgi:hypothetical protein